MWNVRYLTVIYIILPKLSKHLLAGVVLEVRFNGVLVKTMECETHGKNNFKWPVRDDILHYDNEDILCSIEPPFPISRRFYGLSNNDFTKASKANQE